MIPFTRLELKVKIIEKRNHLIIQKIRKPAEAKTKIYLKSTEKFDSKSNNKHKEE